MKKDPAFLFYPTEFMAEIYGLSELDVGRFIIVLCEIFRNGRMTRDRLEQLSQGSTALISKFIQDDTGLYYHQWMQQKMDERKEYAQAQRKKIQDYWDKKKERDIGIDSSRLNKDKDENEDERNRLVIHRNTEVIHRNTVELLQNMQPLNKPSKTWRTDIETYYQVVDTAYERIINNSDRIAEQEKYFPEIDIRLSIERAYKNYWRTEAGWKNKKSKRSKEIDMEMTFINAIPNNKVYKKRLTKQEQDELICKKQQEEFLQTMREQEQYGEQAKIEF